MTSEATLRAAMGAPLPLDKHPTLVADFNAALIAAKCTTVRRVAMFCAQVGHESLGLRYFSELWGPTKQQLRYDPASGTKLSRDLGNTQPGDGYRYRGRGPVQLTGKGGYATFLGWCRAQGYGPPDFLRDPDQVATSRWGFLAASHYWTVRRPGLNPASDAGSVETVTRLVNGGRYGLADRERRYNACLRLGDRLLPTPGSPAPAMPTPAARPLGTELVMEPLAMTGKGRRRFFLDPPGSLVIERAWVSLVVDGEDGAAANVRVAPQKPGGGTGPARVLRAGVLTDGSHTSSRDPFELPRGTDQAQLDWEVSAGATAYLVPAFRAAK